jgi:hypothetical protein
VSEAEIGDTPLPAWRVPLTAQARHEARHEARRLPAPACLPGELPLPRRPAHARYAAASSASVSQRRVAVNALRALAPLTYTPSVRASLHRDGGEPWVMPGGAVRSLGWPPTESDVGADDLRGLPPRVRAGARRSIDFDAARHPQRARVHPSAGHL